MSIQAFREKWAESTKVGNEGDIALGREKYAEEVLKEPIPNTSAALHAQRNALRAEAKILAQEYVKANAERLAIKYGETEQDELVSLVDFYRSQGNEDTVTEITMYIMANYAPKVIRGSMGPGPRIVRVRGR